MAVVPTLEAMQSMSLIMARALQDLHKFIETECNHDDPQEIMALMMGFTTGLILQLRDKIETLEEGLGNKFLDVVNEVTRQGSEGLETIEKLNKDDPSLKESASGIDPTDVPAAINFLQSKLNSDIKTHINELPLILRNDIILKQALAMLIANLFVTLDNKNIDSLIDVFVENIRTCAKTISSNDRRNYN